MATPTAHQVGIITGASSGIGEALARELARRGARPVLAARRRDRIEALAREIRGDGGQALAVTCDVTRDGDVERVAAAAREAFGHIDIVFANAGFSVIGTIDELSLDDVRRQLETNLFGVLRTVKATLPDLKRSRGHLALIGSVLGYLAVPQYGAYAMSKAAVRTLAETLRVELAADGVSVTHVGSGSVESEVGRVNNQGVLQEQSRDPAPPWLRMPAPEAARQILDAIEARRGEVIITRHGKLAVALARHTSQLLYAAMAAASRRRPARRW